MTPHILHPSICRRRAARCATAINSGRNFGSPFRKPKRPSRLHRRPQRSGRRPSPLVARDARLLPELRSRVPVVWRRSRLSRGHAAVVPARRRLRGLHLFCAQRLRPDAPVCALQGDQRRPDSLAFRPPRRARCRRMLLSVVLFQIFAGANLSAARLLNSQWLADSWRPSAGLWFLKDALVNGVLVGFRGTR